MGGTTNIPTASFQSDKNLIPAVDNSVDVSELFKIHESLVSLIA
jgi:hypothetical protein